MDDKLSVLIDFLINFNFDKSKVDKISLDIEKILSQIQPDIDINSDQVKTAISAITQELSRSDASAEELAKTLANLDVDIDTSDLEKSFEEIEKVVEELSQVDMSDIVDMDTSEFEKIAQKFNSAFEDMDDVTFGKEMDKLAQEFVKAKAEAEKLVNTQKNALQAMKASGLEGSAAYQKLEAQIAETEEQLKSMTAVTQVIEQSFDELSKSFAGKTDLNDDDIEKLAFSFSKAKQETEEFISKQKNALQALKASGKEGSDAYNKLEKEISEAEAKLTSMSGTAGNTGRSLTDKIAVAGLAVQGVQNMAQAITDISAPYVALDKATQTMKTLGDEAAEMAPRLREAAISMSKELPFGAGAIQDAMANALASGVQGGEEGLKSFAETAAKLATGGGAEIGAVVQGLGATLNAFGETSERTGQYADWMFNIVNAGVTTIDELNQYLSGVTPTAASMGLAFDKVGGALALMTQKGVPTASAVTKLNALLIEMAKPTAGITEALGAAGISLEDFHKMIADDNIVGALQTLQDGFTKAGKTATQAFSSSEAGAAFNVLMGDVGMFNETLDAVSNTSSSTQFAYEQMSESIEVRTAKMKASFDAFMISVADSTGVFGEFAMVAGQTFSSLAPSITALVGIGSMLPEGFGKKLTDQFVGISDKFSGLVKNMSKEGSMLAKIGPMAMNPWVIGSAAAVGAIALFLTKTEKGQAILTRWGEAGERIWNSLQPVVNALADLGEEVGSALVTVGESIFDLIIMPIETASEIIGALIGTFMELFGTATSGSTAFTSFADILNLVGDAVKTTANGFEYIVTAVKFANDIVIGFVKGVPQLLGVAMEYMKYYLNPINWVSGDEEYEKALGDKLMNAIDTVTGRAKDRLTNAKMENSLESVLEIKGDLDKNKKLEDLVKQYESTTDEISKRSIGEEIAKQMPEAVQGYKSVIDENGKMIEVMDVNISKVKEYATATKTALSKDLAKGQSGYSEALKAKAQEYDSLAKKAEELANKIVAGQMKGLNTKEFEKDYEKLQTSLLEKSRNMSKDLAEGTRLGIKFDEITFPDNVESDFKEQLSGIRDKLKNEKFGEQLGSIMAIKGNLDEQGKIDELLEKYNKATSDMEKNSIAAKMKEITPDAVKQVGVIADAEGRLVKQYDVQIGKVKESAEANKQRLSNDLMTKQGKYLSGLQEETKIYSTQKGKLNELMAEINEKQKKGVDTKALEKQYNELFSSMQGQQQKLISWAKESIAKGVEQDKVYKMLADSFGLSVDEVEKLISKQESSTQATSKQILEVDKLAEAWNKASQANQASLDTNKAAYLQFNKEINDINKKKPQDRTAEEVEKLKNASSERAKLLKQMREENKLNQSIAKQTENLEYAIGEKTREDLRLQRAKELADATKNQIELEMESYRIAQEENLVRENRKKAAYDELLLQQKQVEAIKAQRQGYIDAFKQKKLISTIDSEGVIQFSSSVKEADKDEISNIINDYNMKLKQESIKIEELKMKLKIDEQELQNQVDELDKQKIEWEISIGIKEEDALGSFVDNYKLKLGVLRSELDANNDLILQKQKQLENELNNVSGFNAEQQRESLRIRYGYEILELKRLNVEKIKEEQTTKEKLFDLEEQIYSGKLDRIKAFEDERLRIIAERYEKEIDEFNQYASLYAEATESRYAVERDSSLESLNKGKEAELAKIEEWQDMEAISREQAEIRKADIEEKYRKKRIEAEEKYRQNVMKINAQLRGAELQMQKQKDEDTIKAQLDSLRKQEELLLSKVEIFDEFGKPIFNSSADQQAYEELNQNIIAAQDLLEEKGSDLNVLFNELGVITSEGLTAMFTGDKEAMLDGLRQMMSVVVGYLQKMLSAFVMQQLLSSSVGTWLAALPFPANLVAIPIAKTMIEGAVKLITDPIMSTLTSFASGGRIDQPTLALIGDGSKLGSANREWIFNDPQLITMVQMATIGANAGLIREIKLLNASLASQTISTKLKGQDISVSLLRTSARNNRRAK